MPDHDQEKKANSYWMRELIRLRDSIGISSRGPNAGNPGQRHCQPQVPLHLTILSFILYTQSFCEIPPLSLACSDQNWQGSGHC